MVHGKGLRSWKHTNMTDDRNENRWFYNRQQWMITITNSDNFSQRSHFSLGVKSGRGFPMKPTTRIDSSFVHVDRAVIIASGEKYPESGYVLRSQVDKVSGRQKKPGYFRKWDPPKSGLGRSSNPMRHTSPRRSSAMMTWLPSSIIGAEPGGGGSE